MKILILSVFTLVVFSTATFAGETEKNIENEKSKKTEKVNALTLKLPYPTDCADCCFWFDQFDDGLDRTGATWRANVNKCKTALGCEPDVYPSATVND